MSSPIFPALPTTDKPDYRHAYHQALVAKIHCARKPDRTETTFAEAMDIIRHVQHVTEGIPFIVYLVGWQYDGHDSKYPAWFEVNERLKRPEDDSARDSFLWLIREARRINTTVSTHINMCDAYQNSPLWDQYVQADVMCRDKNGEICTGGVWGGEQSFHISKHREWQSGLAQKRIDRFLELLPLSEQGTVHIDVFSPNPSKYHGVTMEEEVESMREILRYWRSRGVDVTKEWFHHEFANLIPMVYHLNLDEASRLHYAPSTICGGGEGWNARHKRSVFGPGYAGGQPEGGCLYEKAWGRSTDTDSALTADNYGEQVIEQFCLRTLPWYFLNRRRAMLHTHTADRYCVEFTDHVHTAVDVATEKLQLHWRDCLLVDGNDVLMPAEWTDGMLMGYSEQGGRRTWSIGAALAASWTGVGRAQMRDARGSWEDATDIPITNGTLELDLAPGQAVWLRPG